MKKVLLTGASGFIGRHCLLPLLANGYEVHAVFGKSSQDAFSEVRYHHVDLLDPNQVSKLVARVRPTHLLHLAWYTEPGKYWTSPENLKWIQASLGLLQAFAKQEGQRVVIAGSCAEYDWEYGYCSEKVTPLSPGTLYSASKHSLQLTSSAFSQQMDLSAAWGRVFFLYGPHEHPSKLIASVTRSLLQDEPALCSHGNQIRDFLYVQDVADAFVSLLDSEVTGSLNIASGLPVALKDLVYKIAGKLDCQELVRLGVLPTSANEPRLLVADTNRLNKEVGWLPRYDLDRGLEETISWWKNQLAKERSK